MISPSAQESAAERPPRVFASEPLAKFLLAARADLLLAVAPAPIVPHAVFSNDAEDPRDRTSQASELRRCLDVCRDELAKTPRNSSAHGRLSVWRDRLALAYRLAGEGKLLLVGGQNAASCTLEEVEQLAQWGDLDVAAAAGAAKAATHDPPGLIRLEMGVQEHMAGAWIPHHSHPEGPPEAQALALARFRGWEAVSDSATTHAAARPSGESLSDQGFDPDAARTQLRTRCVGTDELVAQAVLEGLLSHAEGTRIRAELAAAGRVFRQLARQPGLEPRR